MSKNVEDILKHLGNKDSVMEPKVLDWIKECMAAKEEPKQLLELLSGNYVGYAQMVNLMYDWNMLLGDEEIAIDREVRQHMKSAITRDFDPVKVDSAFQKECPPKWVEQMILDSEWRDLLYELSEAHPNSTILSYAIQCLSDVGLDADKAGAETATSNLKIFKTKLRETMTELAAGDSE
eukprot:CAMPEP_0113701410 /NCGR_PEP_ID=MMETSP0038_2-20120614/24558_1 /TAXON_ID=2898 /ORGANISM="Cryptomonas paramecium" /LENGTH=178 /DNA_ID=CAMNT_0000625297 /DNA_START=58 /DNA_END=591 /DNA_ORIENTATION=- /assembly_acc=CAM_ASM_000170